MNGPMYQTENRKLRIVHIPHEYLLSLFRKPDCVIYSLIKHPLIPEDCKVLQVHYCYDRAGFAFLVTSESFDPVPDGELVPNLFGPGTVEYKLYDERLEYKRLDELEAMRDQINTLIYDRTK